jgi:hypothetical protein
MDRPRRGGGAKPAAAGSTRADAAEVGTPPRRRTRIGGRKKRVLHGRAAMLEAAAAARSGLSPAVGPPAPAAAPAAADVGPAAGAPPGVASAAVQRINPSLIVVKKSTLGSMVAGKGVFAAVDIPAGTLLTEYGGVKLPVPPRAVTPRGYKKSKQHSHALRVHGSDDMIDGREKSWDVRLRPGAEVYSVPAGHQRGLGALFNAAATYAAANVELRWLPDDRAGGKSTRELRGILAHAGFFFTKVDVPAGVELLWKYTPFIGKPRKPRAREVDMLFPRPGEQAEAAPVAGVKRGRYARGAAGSGDDDSDGGGGGKWRRWQF